jgi:hypothetical protein
VAGESAHGGNTRTWLVRWPWSCWLDDLQPWKLLLLLLLVLLLLLLLLVC